MLSPARHFPRSCGIGNYREFSAEAGAKYILCVPFCSDRYTRLSLVLCMVGIVLQGLVSAVYEGIDAFSFGL